MSLEDNLAQQRALYGEPLADIAARITSSLGLTQARLAEVLGLSAPMLSQLLSGHRVKIGNPAVLSRLQSLNELADTARTRSADDIVRELAAIQDASPTLSSSRTQDPALRELRAAAPADELARLADLTSSPALAALLRAASGHHG